MKRILLFFATLLFVVNISSAQQQRYYIFDIRYLKNSEIWPLAKAVKRKHFKKAEKLLKEHPDWINYQLADSGFSLLAWMAYNSYYTYFPWGHRMYKKKQIAFLIEKGANPYLPIRKKNNLDSGKTPFIYAAEMYDQSKEILQMFLDSKYTDSLTTEELRDQLGYALIAACSKFHPDFEEIKFLIAKGADVNFIGTTYYPKIEITPLTEALFYNADVAVYLIKHENADYNIWLSIPNEINVRKRQIKDDIINPISMSEKKKIRELKRYIELKELNDKILKQRKQDTLYLDNINKQN